MYFFKKNFRIILNLVKSCKDSTHCSHILLTLFPPILISYTQRYHCKTKTLTLAHCYYLKILINFFFFTNVFLFQLIPRYHVVFSHNFSLVSLIWNFLSFVLFLLTLRVLKSTGHIFSRVSLNLGLSNVYAWFVWAYCLG